MEIVLLLRSTLVARLVNIVFPIDGAFNLKVSVATVHMGRYMPTSHMTLIIIDRLLIIIMHHTCIYTEFHN